MKFCLIRLGKDSIQEIKLIDSQKGIQNTSLLLQIKCKQVPADANANTYCFIWLGSDNNKGLQTEWQQGLKAFGKIVSKSGGPNYNDAWCVTFSVGVILHKSVNHHDILANAGAAYYWCSDIPVIGLNTHSNQTIQLIKQDQVTQNVRALLYSLNTIESSLYADIKSQYPELNDYLNYYPSLPLAVTPQIIFGDSYLNRVSEDEVIEVEREDVDIALPLMNQPFNPSLINIENKLLTIDLIIKRLSQKVPEIDLFPDFQRKDDLWDNTKQSRLIESILIRFPLPAFYFDGSNKDKWLVVDGLQRLSSLRNFLIKKTLSLTNLEFLVQLNGMKYDELERDLQRIIEETQVVAFIINPGTPDDVKFNIFKRINTGGLILESQEIRNVIYQGEPTKFLVDLANTEEFRKATSYTISSSRMLDRDFVNRYIAFYLLGYRNYTPDLDTFMSKAMAHVYKMSAEEKSKCKSDFLNSMELNFEIFDYNAFRKIDKYGGRRKPLNKALFDVFSVTFAKLDANRQRKAMGEKEAIKKAFIELIETDGKFVASISTSTSDRNRVNYRFEKIEKLISEIL